MFLPQCPKCISSGRGEIWPLSQDHTVGCFHAGNLYPEQYWKLLAITTLSLNGTPEIVRFAYINCIGFREILCLKEMKISIRKIQ